MTTMNPNIELRKLGMGFYTVWTTGVYIGYVAWFFGWKGVPQDRSQTFYCKSKALAANALFEYTVFK